MGSVGYEFGRFAARGMDLTKRYPARAALGLLALGAAFVYWQQGDADAPTMSAAFAAPTSQDTLPVATARQLLLVAETVNCVTGQVEIYNNTLSEWFFSLAPTAGITQASQDRGDPNSMFDRDGSNTYTHLTFTENGVSLKAEVRQQKLYSDRPPGFNSLRACFVVPGAITILDRTPVGTTGKVMEVRFSETARFSKVGALGQRAPSQYQKGFDFGSRDGEHVAILRRLDATGWRVETVR